MLCMGCNTKYPLLSACYSREKDEKVIVSRETSKVF